MIVKTYNVLVIGTRNSVRSIMAEALFNTMGDGVFKAFSAGIYPAGVVNRFVLEEIKNIGYPYKKLKSKSLTEYLSPKAPIMNFVISVCDDIPIEAIPVMPGNPMKAHWVFEDPGALDGTFDEKKIVFQRVFQQIRNRIDLFTQLPLAHLDQDSFDRGMEHWQTDY